MENKEVKMNDTLQTSGFFTIEPINSIPMTTVDRTIKTASVIQSDTNEAKQSENNRRFSARSEKKS